MTARTKIIFSIMLNIILTLLVTLSIQTVLFVKPFSITIGGSHSFIPALLNSEPILGPNHKITVRLYTPLRIYSSFVFFLSIVYLLILLGISRLTFKIIPLNETPRDWKLCADIITATTALSGLVIPLIILKVLDILTTRLITLTKAIIVYLIIYGLFVTFSIWRSHKRLKGIKKEVFQ